MTPSERRERERRLSDQELEDMICDMRETMEGMRRLIPKEEKFIDTAPQRFFRAGSVIAGIVGALTIVQMIWLGPLTKETEEIEQRIVSLESAVRQHHEESAEKYVLAEVYRDTIKQLQRDIESIKNTMLQVVADHSNERRR